MGPVDTSIFKAYDIRGDYPNQINEILIAKIARGLFRLLLEEKKHPSLSIVVSRDMRLSSPKLHAEVIKTLKSLGCHVIDIGLASTPTFYFAVGYSQADGGIQISASHNPSQWNGCKLVRSKAVPISGNTGINRIRDWIVASDLPKPNKSGKIEILDPLPILLRHQTAGIDLNAIKPYTIVLDPANAMGILDLGALFEKLRCKLVKLNFKLDGTFPNHEADPLKSENLTQISHAVVKNHTDLGIATDGDNDRVFFIDDLGQVVPPEIIRGILAQRILAEQPGANIGYDIRPGKITQDMIIEAGGKPFVTRVGHSLIKEKMLEKNSPFSGESSGHFFYKTPEGSFESPVKVILNFLLWLSQKNLPLSQAVKPLKRYFHSGEINSAVANTDQVIKLVKKTYADAQDISEIDGVTITYPDYWFNVRSSNTEPKIRLNLEAKSLTVMQKKRDEVLQLIRQS